MLHKLKKIEKKKKRIVNQSSAKRKKLGYDEQTFFLFSLSSTSALFIINNDVDEEKVLWNTVRFTETKASLNKGFDSSEIIHADRG